MKVKRFLQKAVKRTAIFVVAVTLVAFLVVLIAYYRSDNDCGSPIAAGVTAMKAIVYCDYGSADVLRIEDVAKPVPSDDQVLIKVRAASANPLDWHFMRGIPYLVRAETGLRRPKAPHLGVDVAGIVEAVGKNVTQFKAGDEVFGACNGSFAEYCLGKTKLALKPANITFEQAASVPIAAITAFQALRDKGKVQPGEKVLINGASGGVGTFAVQIAHSLGANVTGVCSGRNAEMVRSLGADRVIDYTKEDFSQSGERYDLIVDNVGTQPLANFRRALAPDGICVMIGGGGPDEGNWIGPMSRPLKALLLKPFFKERMSMMLGDINKDDLTLLGEMMASGKVTPVIDRTYPLAEVPQAIRYLEEGHARAKVVITVPGS